MLLALVVAAILFNKSQQAYLAAFVLTILVIWMDGLDGYLARRQGTRMDPATGFTVTGVSSEVSSASSERMDDE